jgi:alkylation response protein AidB-like acyl-CoA dehydrogenase
MDLELSETQSLVQKSARDFATRVIQPKAAEIDKKEIFPAEIMKGLAELGLLAVNVPEDLGGAAAGAVSYALAMQEVARACASCAVTMAVTNMVGEVIATFGTDEQKKKYCTGLADGSLVAGSFGLSEPGAGSDPGGMRTFAREDGDSFVLEGEKQWITSGAHAGVMVVWARTAPADTHPGTRGISCILVEKGTPGLKIGRAEDKMGIRGSNTVSLSFENCRVPKSALLGQLHGGFKIAMMGPHRHQRAGDRHRTRGARRKRAVCT